MERDEWKLKIDDEMGNKKENKKKQRKRGNWKIGKDGEEKRKIEMKGSEKNVKKQKDSFRKKMKKKKDYTLYNTSLSDSFTRLRTILGIFSVK